VGGFRGRFWVTVDAELSGRSKSDEDRSNELPEAETGLGISVVRELIDRSGCVEACDSVLFCHIDVDLVMSAKDVGSDEDRRDCDLFRYMMAGDYDCLLCGKLVREGGNLPLHINSCGRVEHICAKSQGPRMGTRYYLGEGVVKICAKCHQQE
jgi:hypothetical protein